MRIIELLLPKSLSDKGLSTKAAKNIDALQTRMNSYVDKICKLAAGTARDFLKTQLRADYNSFKSLIQKSEIVSEAVHKLPLSNEDFDFVKEVMEHPIPAAIARIYLSDILDDDEFNGILEELGETNPSQDMRPLVVEWFRRVMPDQMHRFGGDAQTLKQRLGLLSPIHGYDPHMYSGTNDPITGDAYGRL